MQNSCIMTANINFEELIGGNNYRLEGAAIATTTELPADLDFDFWGHDAAQQKLMNEDQGLNIGFKWTQDGPLCIGLSTDLYWQVELLFEAVGVSEFELPDQHRVHEISYVAAPHTYNATFTIPSDLIVPGVYRLVAMINMRHKNPPPPFDSYMPVAGFVDFGLVQFYED